MCSPSAGAGRVGSAGVRENFTGWPSSRTGPDLRLVELDDHLAGADELRVERLVEVEDRLDAAVVLVVERGPLAPSCAA